MRGEIRRKELQEAGEEGGTIMVGGEKKGSLMAEKTNDDVMYLIGPWILVDERDRTSI